LLEGLLELLKEYGALGTFLISLIGNAIPYSTVPYLLFIAALGAGTENVVDRTLLTVLGGVGAALGKVAVYYMGRTASAVLSDATRHNLELFSSLFRRSVFVATFIFAALPLPDDLLYIPLGIARYNVVYFFLAVVLGKIVITGMAVFFGSTVVALMESAYNKNWLLSLSVGVFATLVATLVIVKMDWQKILKTYEEKGGLHALLQLFVEFFYLFVRLARWIQGKAAGKN